MSEDFQITPQLLGENPSNVCGFDEGSCGRPATWHIFWTADLENGAACDEHYEASKRWAWYTSHRCNEVCLSGIGHLVFLSDGGDSTCVHEDDVDELNASQAIEEQRSVDLDSGRLIPLVVPVAS